MRKTRKEIIDSYKKRVEDAYMNADLDELLKVVEEAYDKGTEKGYAAGREDRL